MTAYRRLRLTLVTTFVVLSHATFVLAQGPLTPPGAPAPTMKTLDQVEPRKEVNATNTPGDSQNLFVISTPGSYYLGANVTGVSGKHGIRIASNDVTLDLNGFALIGIPGSLAGIQAFPGRNIQIRNGLIRDWGAEGIKSLFVFFSVLEDLRLYRNGLDGLEVAGGCIVRNCIASFNGGPGFTFGAVTSSNGDNADEELVENCFATGNGGAGFDLRGGVITKCEARLNSGNGFTSVEAATLADCVASRNVGDGIHAGPGSTITNCTARANAGTYGIFAGEGSTLTNCTARSNTGTYGIRAGVGSTLTNCTAHDNDVEFGIRADDRSTLTNCTASLNTSAAADSWGISAGAQCSISQCSVNGNLNTNGTPSDSTGGGILAGSSSTVQNCTVVGNKGDGIQIVSDSRVVGNNCDSNGFPVGTGNGAGIHSTGTDNRIEGNNVTDNTRGIDVDSTGSLIIKNSASGSSGGAANNYTIAAGNSDAAVETPGTGFTSTNPWANFSF